MSTTHTPARHRAPATYRPERELFIWGCILAALSGVLAAATHEALTAGNTGWVTTFAALTAITAATYFWVAHGIYRIWLLLT